MKNTVLFGAFAVWAFSVCAADSSPKDEITMAAKKLGDSPNYSWKTTVVVPESARFKPGPSEGKTEKDGFTHVTMSFGDNSVQVVLKGDKGAATNREGEWQSLSDLENAQGPARFFAALARNFKVPALQAAELASDSKELKKEGDNYSAELTDEGAKKLLRFGRRRDGGDGPAVNGAKGSVRFWLNDGTLSKYEFKVKGTINFNGNDIEVDRATTVEIKDVGSTKLSVPEEAKKKLS